MTFGQIVRAAREERCWNKTQAAAVAGIDLSYIKKIENQGFPPSREIVEDLARALELDLTHALVHAGYVPEMAADDWEAILLDCRSLQLQPNLRRALRGLQGLSPAQLREADGVLQGLARGFRAGRRRAS